MAFSQAKSTADICKKLGVAELLNGEILETMREAKVLIEAGESITTRFAYTVHGAINPQHQRPFSPTIPLPLPSSSLVRLETA